MRKSVKMFYGFINRIVTKIKPKPADPFLPTMIYILKLPSNINELEIEVVSFDAEGFTISWKKKEQRPTNGR